MKEEISGKERKQLGFPHNVMTYSGNNRPSHITWDHGEEVGIREVKDMKHTSTDQRKKYERLQLEKEENSGKSESNA